MRSPYTKHFHCSLLMYMQDTCSCSHGSFHVMWPLTINATTHLHVHIILYTIYIHTQHTHTQNGRTAKNDIVHNIIIGTNLWGGVRVYTGGLGCRHRDYEVFIRSTVSWQSYRQTDISTSPGRRSWFGVIPKERRGRERGKERGREEGGMRKKKRGGGGRKGVRG